MTIIKLLLMNFVMNGNKRNAITTGSYKVGKR